jgi:hypothetical protein
VGVGYGKARQLTDRRSGNTHKSALVLPAGLGFSVEIPINCASFSANCLDGMRRILGPPWNAKESKIFLDNKRSLYYFERKIGMLIFVGGNDGEK